MLSIERLEDRCTPSKLTTTVFEFAAVPNAQGYTVEFTTPKGYPHSQGDKLVLPVTEFSNAVNGIYTATITTPYPLKTVEVSVLLNGQWQPLVTQRV